MADVDSLSIQISASSDEATKKLKELADAMRQLREAGKASISRTVGNSITQLADALRAVSDDDFNRLGRMTKALERLSAVSRTRIPRDLADSLFNIGQAVRAIPDEAVTRLDGMTRALQRLQNVRMRDVTRTLRNAVTNDTTAANSGITNVESTAGTGEPEAVAEAAAERVHLLADAWHRARAAVQGYGGEARGVLGTLAKITVHAAGKTLAGMFNSAIAPMADRLIRFKSGKVTEEKINQNPVPIEKIEW